MKKLPADVRDLAGLRAARWVRESTEGQYDAFGPESQRDHQDRAISQFGMHDTGIVWSVAASGWTEVWDTPDFKQMIAMAGTSFDVLVVAYSSRFMRNLKQSLIFRDQMHEHGAAVYLCDERILSSDDRSWDEWVREAHDAEAFSRKLSRRVSEGYEVKRRRLGSPGATGHRSATPGCEPNQAIRDPSRRCSSTP